MLPAAVSGLTRQFLRDWWFFLAGLIIWSFSGVVAAHSPFPIHVEVFRQADRLLFFGRDPVVVVQNALAHRGAVGPVDVIAAIIYNMHVPEIYISGYFLWRLSRAVYLQFTAMVLILFVLGFLTYVFLPAVQSSPLRRRGSRAPISASIKNRRLLCGPTSTCE